MARISDVYEFTSKATGTGLKTSLAGLKAIGGALDGLRKIGAAPFHAMRSSLKLLPGAIGVVTKGFGAFGLAMQSVQRARQAVGAFFGALRESSPKAAAALGHVERQFAAVKKQLLSKVGDVLAPIIERIAKAMSSPSFKKFIDLIGTGLARAFQSAMGPLGLIFKAASGLFEEFEDGSRPIDSLRGSVVAVARAFGLSEDATFRLWEIAGQVEKFFNDQLLPTLREVAKVLLDHLASAWQTLQEVIGVVWEWLRTNVFEPLFAAAQQIGEAFVTHGAEIQAAFNNLWSAIGPIIELVIGKLSEIFQAVIPQVVAAFIGIIERVGPAVEAIAEFIRVNFDKIKAVVEGVFGGARAFIEGAIQAIGGVIQVVLDVISGRWESAWSGIKRVAESIWNAIKGIVEGAVKAVKGVLDLLGAALREPWEGIKAFVEGVWQGVKDVVKAGVNAVIDFINGLLQGFNDSFAADIFGELALIPRVTSLAQGAVVSAPTLAVVGDRPQGPEVVAGLDQLIPILQKALAGAGPSVVVQVNGPFGPGYTPEQAGAGAADAFVRRARALGYKV